MVISSAAGELTLGIGLGFVSVGLGILGLIIKSDCEELSCCYGLIWCKKKRKRTRRGSGDSGSSGVGVVALVVAFTQETFSASPENRRRIFPRNMQSAWRVGGGCMRFTHALYHNQTLTPQLYHPPSPHPDSVYV